MQIEYVRSVTTVLIDGFLIREYMIFPDNLKPKIGDNINKTEI